MPCHARGRRAAWWYRRWNASGLCVEGAAPPGLGTAHALAVRWSRRPPPVGLRRVPVPTGLTGTGACDFLGVQGVAVRCGGHLQEHLFRGALWTGGEGPTAWQVTAACRFLLSTVVGEPPTAVSEPPMSVAQTPPLLSGNCRPRAVTGHRRCPSSCASVFFVM